MRHAIGALLVTTLLCGALHAQTPAPEIALGKREITVTFRFPKAELIPAGGALAVRMDGLRNTVEAGLPAVPVKTIRLALPHGMALDGVSMTAGEETAYSGEIVRAPGQRPISWASSPPRNLPAVPAPRIEGARYPESRLAVSVQRLHGVAVAIVNVYPLTVNRDGNSSRAIQSAVVTIRLKPAPSRDAHVLLPHQLEEVRALVDDPTVLTSYAARADKPRDGYDYLIISTESLIGYSGENGLKDFQASLEARGLKVRIADIATIQATKAGADVPEKVRNFIRDEYRDAGIQYVLLAGRGKTSGGASGLVPARRLWSKIRAYMNGAWHDEEQHIPSDFYYGALDGDFNGNKNEKSGEPNDGENGGDVDFLPEVTVGRAVLDSTTDLQSFVRKSLQAAARRHAKRTLMLGEELFPEKDLSGSDYLVQLEGNVTEHGTTTDGYGTDWGIDKLDDRVRHWSGSEALGKVNSGGFSMVNHLGHSNQSYNMRLSSMGGLPSFTNEAGFFYYTQGCLAGRYVDGSFVDKMVKHRSSAFAAVANTTYGLAPEDPTPSLTKTPGASHMLHRQFVQAVLHKRASLGKANDLSKQAHVELKSAQEIRWVIWTATLFGDPSLQLAF